MKDCICKPKYHVEKFDIGWAVFLVIGMEMKEALLIDTKKTWVGTFASEYLAYNYIEMITK